MAIRNKEEWFDLFKAHQQSGLSMAEFCRQEGLNKKYFSSRRKQLDFKSGKQKSVRKTVPNDFIQVSVKANHGYAICLEYGELRLSLQQLPETRWLADLAKTLK